MSESGRGIPGTVDMKPDTSHSVLRILLLEDNPDDADFVLMTIRRDSLKFVSKVVDDRNSFIHALREFRPDVILSDHSLPQFNSLEAFDICRHFDPDIPFILVTGAVSDEFAVDCIKKGIDDYVLKNNLARLTTAIHQAIHNHQVQRKKREAEQALQQQNQELIELNRQLDNFVYSLSHNLRGPITTMKGLIYLKQLEQQHQKVSDTMDMMENSLSGLSNILDDFFEYSYNYRYDTVLEEINVEDLIREIASRLKIGEGRLTLTPKLQKKQPVRIVSDRYRLNVILTKIISNALKYVNPDREPKIDVELNIENGRLTIHIKDNGEGVGPEVSGKIFDMFYRASDKSRGSGLGLFIAREMIVKLGGEIMVKSVLNEGSVFSINLPANGKKPDPTRVPLT